jgi:hypothetical protein
MEGSTTPGRGEGAPPRAADHRLWLLALPALLAWQAWLALGLFGPDDPLRRLLDDQPVLSGRHPLHLYHGYLGARALLERGSLSCYDPSFHAGYPKTPVFDSGSRPAELLLALMGGRFCPAAYKVGLALLALAVPWLLYRAARRITLSRAAACLASLLGVLVWWSEPCRNALEAGAVDLLLASVLAVAQAGLLIHYHRGPGPVSLLGVALTALLGWFAHPLLFLLLLPWFLVYYLSVGTRHQFPWHVALLGGLLAALAANSFWLLDWVGYWWIRAPAHLESTRLAHRTLRAVWEAPLWGGPTDRVLAWVLILAALGGVLLFNQTGQRATARLVGLGGAGLLVLSILGLTSEPMGQLCTTHLLVPALLLITLPAAHALACLAQLAARWPASRWGSAAALGLCVAWLWLRPPAPLAEWAPRLLRPIPLTIGFNEDQAALLDVLDEHTGVEGRILWEDHHIAPTQAHWTSLLPLLTKRSYVGGLDADAAIEHTAGGLTDQLLAGRPIGEWSDAQLHDYCTRYNIGWVACWSPHTGERLRRWGEAKLSADLPPAHAGGQAGWLFKLERTCSYALRGSARWLGANAHQIVLADVVPRQTHPDDPRGQVVLSLHYQAGMRVTPSRVILERAEESADAIPFVRLRVADPVTRVTITWGKR